MIAVYPCADFNINVFTRWILEIAVYSYRHILRKLLQLFYEFFYCHKLFTVKLDENCVCSRKIGFCCEQDWILLAAKSNLAPKLLSL